MVSNVLVAAQNGLPLTVALVPMVVLRYVAHLGNRSNAIHVRH